MNLIANSCIGGYLYKLHNEQFANPFIWAMLDTDAMINCINKFCPIDWGKIKLEKDINNPYPDRHTYNIIVDAVFRIHYTHYLHDDNYLTPTKVKIDVHGKEIYRYVVDKYLKRVQRMISMHETPVFCILGAEFLRYDFSYDNTKRLIENTMDSPFHKIIITNYADLACYQSSNTHIFISDYPVNQGKYNTKWYANEYYNKIMDIVNIAK